MFSTPQKSVWCKFGRIATTTMFLGSVTAHCSDIGKEFGSCILLCSEKSISARFLSVMKQSYFSHVGNREMHLVYTHESVLRCHGKSVFYDSGQFCASDTWYSRQLVVVVSKKAFNNLLSSTLLVVQNGYIPMFQFVIFFQSGSTQTRDLIYFQ